MNPISRLLLLCLWFVLFSDRLVAAIPPPTTQWEILQTQQNGLATIGEVSSGVDFWPWAWWSRPHVPGGGEWVFFWYGGSGPDDPYAIWSDTAKDYIFAYIDSTRFFGSTLPTLASTRVRKQGGGPNDQFLDLCVYRPLGGKIEVTVADRTVRWLTLDENIPMYMHIDLSAYLGVTTSPIVSIKDASGNVIPMSEVLHLSVSRRSVHVPDWMVWRSDVVKQSFRDAVDNSDMWGANSHSFEHANVWLYEPGSIKDYYPSSSMADYDPAQPNNIGRMDHLDYIDITTRNARELRFRSYRVWGCPPANNYLAAGADPRTVIRPEDIHAYEQFLEQLVAYGIPFMSAMTPPSLPREVFDGLVYQSWTLPPVIPVTPSTQLASLLANYEDQANYWTWSSDITPDPSDFDELLPRFRVPGSFQLSISANNYYWLPLISEHDFQTAKNGGLVLVYGDLENGAGGIYAEVIPESAYSDASGRYVQVRSLPGSGTGILKGQSFWMLLDLMGIEGYYRACSVGGWTRFDHPMAVTIPQWILSRWRHDISAIELGNEPDNHALATQMLYGASGYDDDPWVQAYAEWAAALMPYTDVDAGTADGIRDSDGHDMYVVLGGFTTSQEPTPTLLGRAMSLGVTMDAVSVHHYYDFQNDIQQFLDENLALTIANLQNYDKPILLTETGFAWVDDNGLPPPAGNLITEMDERLTSSNATWNRFDAAFLYVITPQKRMGGYWGGQVIGAPFDVQGNPFNGTYNQFLIVNEVP